MKHYYTLRDYWHYLCMFQRNKRRQKIWGKKFEAAVRNKTFKLPFATVVQLIPTEACNLRCPMCNQWGEKGYFLEGVREADHMDKSSLIKLFKAFSPTDSLISVHGGEPFVYKHFDTLMELLCAQQFDVLLSTNGTLIHRYLDQLAELKNLALLLSVDGAEKTHDRIRGKGRFQQIKQGLLSLFEFKRRNNQPLPLVIMNFVVCEWNPTEIEKVYDVAQDFGVFVLNYNMRWFLTEEVGLAYEKHLLKHFGLQSSGAWRGWISNYENNYYKISADNLRHVLRKTKYQVFPPYVVTMPKQLKGNDFEVYHNDYLNVFGNESCFMPYYLARIHANGDLIYCPGHPDIIVGNVFRDGFMQAFNSELSIKFRRHILHNRFPICNRCCGLYMTEPARPYEQKARRHLGLSKEIKVHFP